MTTLAAALGGALAGAAISGVLTFVVCAMIAGKLRDDKEVTIQITDREYVLIRCAAKLEMARFMGCDAVLNAEEAAAMDAQAGKMGMRPVPDGTGVRFVPEVKVDDDPPAVDL